MAVDLDHSFTPGSSADQTFAGIVDLERVIPLVEGGKVTETTALGAAYLAGYQAGVCPDPAGFSATWRLDRRFEPVMDEATRARKWIGWQAAVARVRTSPGATR